MPRPSKPWKRTQDDCWYATIDGKNPTKLLSCDSISQSLSNRARNAALHEEKPSAERDIVIGHIAEAETAASRGDAPSVVHHLKTAGKWALNAAERIGVAVTAGILKTQLGM